MDHSGPNHQMTYIAIPRTTSIAENICMHVCIINMVATVFIETYMLFLFLQITLQLIDRPIKFYCWLQPMTNSLD